MRAAAFHVIDRATWPRSGHFDYYVEKIHCRYDLTANLTITRQLRRVKTLGLRFYPTLLYLAARAVNANREFRMSFDADGVLGYWDFVNPSYTIFHDDDKTFSDVWSDYEEAFPAFYRNVLRDMETCKNVKGILGKPDKPPNFCPMSALPWLSFTGMTHVLPASPPFLFPIIAFGKYFSQGDETLIPVSVSVHHAAADGYHTCKLINDMQTLADAAEDWLTGTA